MATVTSTPSGSASRRAHRAANAQAAANAPAAVAWLLGHDQSPHLRALQPSYPVLNGQALGCCPRTISEPVRPSLVFVQTGGGHDHVFACEASHFIMEIVWRIVGTRADSDR